MKVLIITNTIQPDSGWGRYSSAIVTEYQKRSDFTFTVLTEYSEFKPLNSVKSFLENVVTIRKIARDFDIIHAFDGWPYAVYGYLAVVGTRKRLFINAVGTYAIAPLTSRLKGFFLTLAYRRAEKIFAISFFIKKKLLALINLDTVEVVYLGLPVLPKPTDQEVNHLKVIYHLTTHQPILLTVGAIKQRKGQDDTVKAVALLKKQYPNILYLMVGNTRDRAFVAKINQYIKDYSLEDNVKIFSAITTDQELATFYSLADVVLLNAIEDNYHVEGFGLSLLEAAQFGKPVVGSHNSGTVEAMKDGYNGYIALAKNPDSIAEAVVKVLHHKDYLSKNSLIFAKEFSWANTASAYSSAYAITT